MAAALRAVVVGPGYIGPVHIDALRRNGVQVTGLVGSGSDRGIAAAAALGIPAFATLTDALGAGPVDCVHIATPNYLHAPLALEAIEAGKHVVCEKPLGMTAAEGEMLLRAAEEAGVVHAVNFNFRFYAMPRQARAMIRAGEIGPVRLIHGGYLQDWLLRADDWNWRLDPALGGSPRAVADIGSHWMDLMGFVTGQHPAAVCADLATTVPVRKRPVQAAATFGGQTGASGAREEVAVRTEDYASVLVRFTGGAHGVFTVSQVSAGRKNSLRFEIDGGEAALGWDSERGEELWIGRRGAPSGVLPRDLALLDPDARAVTTAPPGHAEGYIETHRALFAAVYRAIAAGGPPEAPEYPTFADGLRSLRLCEAVVRSAEDERWVETGGAA
ncbi:MAG: Gfo/Idh/MocA family protein [Chloroflexota bacterium]